MGRNIPLMLSTLGETWGLSSVAAWRLCCRWASLPAGDEGCGVTDDSELVGLSDRVMAGRHRLMDQARREGMEGEEGSLAWSLCFSVRGDVGGGESGGKNKSRSAQVAAVYLGDDWEAPMLVDEVFPERSSLCGLLVQPALLTDTEIDGG